jgi:serine/threonine protein kinase
MDKYKIIEKIGDGAYGSVTKYQNLKTGEIVAVKQMK